MTIQVVILAAGLGTRLARPHPKSLTRLRDGRTILEQQLENLRKAFGSDLRPIVVVGYKLDSIMEHVPDVAFVYNECYDQTNTSKSLLKALTNTAEGGVLWLNGDIVFDSELLDLLKPHIADETSAVSVNHAMVDHEAVKYTTSADGYIDQLSKEIPLHSAQGEALGINYVSSKDKHALIRHLQEVDDQDYFERAIEVSITSKTGFYAPVDTSQYSAIEIDCQDDLTRANDVLRPKSAQ